MRESGLLMTSSSSDPVPLVPSDDDISSSLPCGEGLHSSSLPELSVALSESVSLMEWNMSSNSFPTSELWYRAVRDVYSMVISDTAAGWSTPDGRRALALSTLSMARS